MKTNTSRPKTKPEVCKNHSGYQDNQLSHTIVSPHARLSVLFAPQHFSPNELYRKGMVFWQMAQPYLSFMKEADAIMCWGRPWRRWEVCYIYIRMLSALRV